MASEWIFVALDKSKKERNINSMKHGNTKNKSKIACSLIINVARGDVPILQYTLPHIFDTHKIHFDDIVIVVDESAAEGRIRQHSPQYSLEELYGVLGAMRQQGYEFRQETVSYNRQDVKRTFSKWFGRSSVGFRCAGGTPIYAFLYGLEQAQYDFCLHLDSDMLIYDPGPTSWVQKAVEVLKNTPEVLFVNQTWGPQTRASASPKAIPSVDLGFEQRVSQVFSTRCFLFSMRNLEERFLPIVPVKHPILKRVIYSFQRRSSYLALEQIIGLALVRKNFFRADLDLEWGFNLHAWDKRVFQDTQITIVLNQIAAGQIPVEHQGQHDLNYDLFLHCSERGS